MEERSKGAKRNIRKKEIYDFIKRAIKYRKQRVKNEVVPTSVSEILYKTRTKVVHKKVSQGCN